MKHRPKPMGSQDSLYSLPMQVPARVFWPNFCKEQSELLWESGSEQHIPSGVSLFPCLLTDRTHSRRGHKVQPSLQCSKIWIVRVKGRV